MNEQDNIHIQSINTVAEILNLSPRRIRQFCEDGNLKRLGRGKVDLTWAMYFDAGSLLVSDLPVKSRDSKTLVAFAWLNGVGDEPNAKDIDAFAELFTRNGFTRDQALLAIGKAEGLLK